MPPSLPAMTAAMFARKRGAPVDLTGNVTLSAGQSRAAVTNTSAANITTTATLPPSPVPDDTEFTFIANNGGGAAVLQVRANTGQVIQQGGSASPAGGAATFPAGVIGGTVTYRWVAGKWIYVSGGGTAPTLGA